MMFTMAMMKRREHFNNLHNIPDSFWTILRNVLLRSSERLITRLFLCKLWLLRGSAHSSSRGSMHSPRFHSQWLLTCFKHTRLERHFRALVGRRQHETCCTSNFATKGCLAIIKLIVFSYFKNKGVNLEYLCVFYHIYLCAFPLRYSSITNCSV